MKISTGTPGGTDKKTLEDRRWVGILASNPPIKRSACFPFRCSFLSELEVSHVKKSLDGQTLPLFGSMLETGYVFSKDRKLRATIQASVRRGGNLFQNIKAAEAVIMKVYSDQELIVRQESEDEYMLPPRVFNNGRGQAIRTNYHIVAMTFGYMIGGAVLVEVVFSWPGIGTYAVQAMDFSDYDPVLGVVLLSATIYVVIYFLVDLVQVLLDPRLRE